MSQATPAGEGSGKRPGGSPPGKPTQPRRPAAKSGAAKPTSGRPASGKGRPPGSPGGKGGPRPATGKAGARPNRPVASAPPRRFSPSTMGFVAVAVVVVVVVVLVIVKVTGGSTPSGTGGIQPATVTAAPPSLVSEVTGIPQSVETAVGTGSGVTPPNVVGGQPPLTSGGHPEVLFIGAEFCPYCAAERWAMVNAFSRFGTWSGLQLTTSSPWDDPAQVATFTFVKAHVTSPYADFVLIEHQSNDKDGLGTRTTLEALTTAQQNLWTNWSAHFGEQTGYPFVDLGNKFFVIGPSYNPDPILLGLSQSEIASKLKNTKDPVTEAIVGTANYLTASICNLTHDQPSSVCSAPGVKAAMTSLKVS